MTLKTESQYVKRPSFCYITPISYMGYAIASRTHLVLAHLVDAHPEYAAFYKALAEQGDFVMMDNSAYELKEPYAPEKLITLGGLCGAHVIVLPDYPFQECSITIEAAKKFIPVFKDAGFGTFFVPQSKTGDVEDWIRGYEWAAGNPDVDVIGHSILGVPNALSNIDPSYARVVMAATLIDRGIYADYKHNHYLGLNAGPALEIPSLLRMNAIHTMDSSGPVWTAILGHEYTKNSDSFLQVKKPVLGVDFGIKRSKDAATLARIAHNIEMTNSLFEGGAVTPWFSQDHYADEA